MWDGTWVLRNSLEPDIPSFYLIDFFIFTPIQTIFLFIKHLFNQVNPIEIKNLFFEVDLDIRNK